MNEHSEIERTRNSLDILKWIVVIFLLVISISGSYFYSNKKVLLGMLIAIVFLCSAIFVALLTKRGRKFILFAREARIELQKIIWPSRKETLRTTLIIVIATITVSIILWGLDSILVHLISLIIRLRL